MVGRTNARAALLKAVQFSSEQSESAQAGFMINVKSCIVASFVVLTVSPISAFAETQDSGEAEAVHRLSPDEMAEITASRDESQIDAATLLGRNADGQLPRRIQSEVSFGIGTGGYRELSASTLIPFGKDGFLALGFGHVEDNRPRRYHHGRGHAF